MNEKGRTAVMLGIASSVGVVFLLGLPDRAQLSRSLPDRHGERGYLGSGACQSCHPEQHASWKKTYHRSMSRVAGELGWDGVKSPKIPVQLQLHQRSFRLSSGDGVIKYRGPDLHWIGRRLPQIAQMADASDQWKIEKSIALFAQSPEVEKQLVMVTGSHHYLAFWIEGGEQAELRQLPFIYLLDEKRFLPRREAFLQPPESLPYLPRWNANCIQCHSVAGRPGQSEGIDAESGEFWQRYETTVVELGIACESCHGPGDAHADLFRSPLRRVQVRASKETNGESLRIFVPDESAGLRGSETCGQCHSYFVPTEPDEWWRVGLSENYVAGDPLGKSRRILRSSVLSEAAPPYENVDSGEASFESLSAREDSVFWDDGSIIVGGREFNGLSQSPCFVRGVGDKKLACGSCHELHGQLIDGQLNQNRLGDKMCTQCHLEIESGHSRHQPTSSGARCINCHMPRTSYALLQGIRTHQISIPTTNLAKPPNACILCHVDRSGGWVKNELSREKAQDAVAEPELRDVGGMHQLPVAVISSLSGNAAERATFAYAWGTDDAFDSAGDALAKKVLPLMQKDPYAAVAHIATRSLGQVMRRAKVVSTQRSHVQVSEAEMAQLIERRDNSPIVISE